MNIEEMLEKYKLREPSADLKARIALATKDEWKKPAIVVEFRRSLWRVAISLAASLLIAFTGITVNSSLISQGIDQAAFAGAETDINTDPELGLGAMARLHFPAGRQQSVDLTCLVKRHDMINEELNKGG